MKSIVTAKRIVLVIIISLLIMLVTKACTLHYYTPTFWTAHIDQPTNQCPDISGSYINGGVNIGGKSVAYLYEELTKKTNYFSKECEECTVEIHRLDEHNQAYMISMKVDQKVYSKQISKAADDFRCDSGALIIDYKIIMEAIIEGRWQFGTRTFKTREDGSIVRKDQLSAYFHWLIIPWGFKDIIEYAQWLEVEVATTNSTDMPTNK